MKWPLSAIVVLFCAFSTSACGGGGGNTSNPLPSGAAPSVAPATKQPKATPSATPTSSPSTPTATPYPPDQPSKLPSTYGRIGLAQIFDYFPSDGTSMPASQITADAGRYDFVWASFDPQPWRASNPGIPVSRYYIIEEDSILISGHNLAWWQQNHPDWILYACTADGAPTKDIAYTPGDGFADVPLNIHNPNVVAYQLRQSLIPYVLANGYNAIGLDEVIFNDFMRGGNPQFGQTVKPGEYACGVWNTDGTFTTVYQNPQDPAWAQDVLNWIDSANLAGAAAGVTVSVNHAPQLSLGSNEQTLLKNVAVTADEGGFSDYGNYQQQSDSYLFLDTYRYMEYVQREGVAIVIIDRFASSQVVTSDQLEYSIATYLMGNEGSAVISVSGKNDAGYGYGAENYHTEYGLQLGKPCGAMYGGTSYDAANPQIYYRRFQNGLVVVNSGSLPQQSENATLPPRQTYTDLELRQVTNPLIVLSNDAWVLLSAGGNGCN